MHLIDALQVNWELGFTREQRLTLLLAANLPHALVRRRWHELSGFERDRLIIAARSVLATAAVLSGDLSGHN